LGVLALIVCAVFVAEPQTVTDSINRHAQACAQSIGSYRFGQISVTTQVCRAKIETDHINWLVCIHDYI